LPLTIDLGHTTIDFDGVDGARKSSIRAVNAGQGSIPSRIDLSGTNQPLLIVPANAERTVWIAFPARDEAQVARLTLNLAFLAGEPLAITIYDPCHGGPRWTFARPSLTGFAFRTAAHVFGGFDSGRYAPLGLALWHARGAMKVGVGYEWGPQYVASSRGYDRADAQSLELAVAWRPPRWTVGGYIAGQVTNTRYQIPEISDGWSPSVSVGIEAPLGAGLLPLAVLRLGYIHIFDGRMPQRDGLSIGIEARVWAW
jgi:hypothetical protein